MNNKLINNQQNRWVYLLQKNFHFFRIRVHYSPKWIRGSGSTSTWSGSETLLKKSSNYIFIERVPEVCSGLQGITLASLKNTIINGQTTKLWNSPPPPPPQWARGGQNPPYPTFFFSFLMSNIKTTLSYDIKACFIFDLRQFEQFIDIFRQKKNWKLKNVGKVKITVFRKLALLIIFF